MPENDGYECCIYGEDMEQTYEALESEAYHYRNDSSVEFDEIEDPNEEWIEVLASNLDFFINR